MSTQPEAHPEFPPHDDKVHAGAIYWYVGKDGKYYSSNEVKLFMHSKSKSLFFEPPEWMQKHHNLIPLYTDPPTDDTALLQQALDALLMMRDQYSEEACPACDHADAAVYALRDRLGDKT